MNYCLQQFGLKWENFFGFGIHRIFVECNNGKLENEREEKFERSFEMKMEFEIETNFPAPITSYMIEAIPINFFLNEPQLLCIQQLLLHELMFRIFDT